MFLPKSCSGSFLEYLHFYPPYIPTHPFIEDSAQKSAPEFNRHREWADATFGVRLRLDHRQKAHIWCFDLFEETVHVRGVPDIMRINNTEDIAINPVLSQEFIPTHCFLVSGTSIFSDSAAVMLFPGTVQAEPDNKALRRKKSTPVLVDESPIGLNPVCNAPVRWLILALQRHNLAIVVQSQHGWFTAMPGKADQRFGACIDVLDDILFQNVIGHPKRADPWIELFLLKIIAIVAIQITDGAGWLGEDLKLTRDFGQICVFL